MAFNISILAIALSFRLGQNAKISSNGDLSDISNNNDFIVHPGLARPI